MYKLCIVLFAINTVQIYSQSCKNVKNLVVEHRNSESSKWESTVVTGCISDESFKTTTVEEIKIACETTSLGKLVKHFLTNMSNLRHVLIESCKIAAVEPGAFLNLPKLETLILEGNPLRNISRGVFDVIPSIRKLYLYYNKISYIEDHAFANLPNLNYFSLEANKLNYIRKEWFTNTNNIEEFLIDNNSIHRIPQNMFHGWKRLSEVNFNANNISSIDEGTFLDNAPVMQYISLHHNRLTSIFPKIVSDNVFIENLIISGNLLNYLSDDFLENVRVNNIYIFSNPFKCTCLDKIYRSFEEREITVDDPSDTELVKPCKSSNVPVCATPSDNSTTCMESIDNNVTHKVISAMKSVKYDTLRTESQYPCAMFNYESPV